MDAHPADETVEVLQTHGTIVIAGDHDDWDLQPQSQLGQDVVEQPDSLRRRDRSVVYVARDHDGVDAPILGEAQQGVQREPLVVGERHVVQRLA